MQSVYLFRHDIGHGPVDFSSLVVRHTVPLEFQIAFTPTLTTTKSIKLPFWHSFCG